jgi:hypothetical protein
MKATPESILSLAARTATKLGTLDLDQATIQAPMSDPDHPYWKAIENALPKAASEKVPENIRISLPPKTFFDPRHMIEDTNLRRMIKSAEVFIKKVFDRDIVLLETFDFPKAYPWENMLIAYDPGDRNCSQMFNIFSRQGLEMSTSVKLIDCVGFEASGTPTLHLIEDSSLRELTWPNRGSGESPAADRFWLEMRGYTFAFGLKHFVDNKYLDVTTSTLFPKNGVTNLRMISYGEGIMNGAANPVHFSLCSKNEIRPRMRPRLAMPIPARSKS